jgi:hypothetical protein
VAEAADSTVVSFTSARTRRVALPLSTEPSTLDVSTCGCSESCGGSAICKDGRRR